MPIFTALAGIGSVLGSIGTFLSSGTFLAGIANAGLGLAAQFAVGALFPQQTQSRAVQLETTYGTNLHRQVVLGTVGVAGHHIYRNAATKGNRWVRDVFVVSNFRIQGIERVRKDGKWITLSPPNANGYRETDTFRVSMRIYLGTLTQVADDALISTSNPPGRWTANHRGIGQAYVHVSNPLHPEQHPQPWQAFFEVIGPKLYDWRKDSTVGGVGGDRFNDPATWTGRHDHPVLQMYLLERGVYQNGELIVGKGVSASRLPLDMWSLAANICDELVAGKPRYSSNLIAVAGPGATHKSNMDPLLHACAGSWLSDATGEYPIVGANQAVVSTITDADLMPDDSFRWSKNRSRSELINTIAGQYTSVENFYDTGDLAIRNLPAALVEDGERLATSIMYDAVTDTAQADRLTDIQLRANRYQANADICVHPKFLQVKPGQWIRWNSATRGDRKYQVLGRRLGPVGDTAYRNVYWRLQEVGDGIFDPTAFVTNPPIPVQQGEPDYQTELDGFQLLPVIVENVDGIQRAGFKANWNALEDESVTQVEFKYWPTNQPDAVFYQTVPANALTTTILNSIVQRTQYGFQYRLIADPPRPTVFTATILRTALEVDSEFYPIDLKDLGGDVKSWQEWIGSAVRDVTEELRALGAQTGSDALSMFSTVSRVRTELTAQTGALSAKFTDELIAATGPNSALSQRLTTLEVDQSTYARLTVTDALTARITTAEGVLNIQGSAITSIQGVIPGKANITALQSIGVVATDGGGNISGLGTAILGIQSEINGVTASSTFKMQGGYTPEAGWTSRIGMEARINSGATFRAAGLFIDTTTTQARIVLSADQIAILAGGTVAALFQTGTTFINAARINNLDATNITVSGRFSAPDIILNGSALTSMLAFDTVTARVSFNGTSAGATGGSWVTVVSQTIDNPNPNPVFINALLNVTLSRIASGSGTHTVRLRNVTTNVVLASVGAAVSESTASDTNSINQMIIDDSPTSAGSYQYAIERMSSGINITPGNSGGTTKMIWWKR